MADTTALRLTEALARLDSLTRERLESLRITQGDQPTVQCIPHPSCGHPFTGPIAPTPPIPQQIDELRTSGLLGTIDATRHGEVWTIQPWYADKEAKAWATRIALSLLHPTHADLLRASGQVKVQQWRLDQRRRDLEQAIWRADGAMRGTTRSELLALSQTARSTFYAAIAAKPDIVDGAVEELPFNEDPTPPATDSTPPEEARPTTPPTAQRPATPAPKTPARPAPAASKPASVSKATGGRFSAPAVVLDASSIHFADGSTEPWQAQHIGELALLAQTYQLGWGGGEDRLPDLGQVWLGSDALTALGLPTSLGVSDDIPDQDKWAKAIKEAFATISKTPAFTLAEEAGWEFSTVHAWTRVWHPELCRAGAWIVAVPWQTIGTVSLLASNPDDDVDAMLDHGITAPSRLAARVKAFAQATGVAYRLTPAATGLDLIDHTRPPRRHEHDDRGAGRNRAALIRGVAAEIPPFLNNTHDGRFANLESDFSWWRPWHSLTESEQAKKYVVAFDRGRSYLAPWSSISLGLEGLIHDAEQPVWNGKEEPGYWLIDTLTDDQWPWWLPDVSKAAGARIEDDRMWVTTHTLRQLDMVGITPTIHESYTWATTARYLEPAAKQLRQALEAADDPAVVATIKNMYSSTVGKLGQREHRTHYHLWRPDWRHHIIAATRTAILRGLITAQERTGAIPLVVDRDTIMYAVDTDQVTEAWPGDPKKLGVGIGAWKPAGIAPLADWGPDHLPNTHLSWRYRYNDAMAAMTPWTE